MPLIGPEHPRYLELFAAAFGAGQSYPARLVKNPPPAPDLEPIGLPLEQDPGHEQQGDPQPDKS